jgi:hypothetical protein
MSPFLYHVSRLVSHSVWIDPHLFCRSVDDGGTTEFIAADDSWYGSLTAQHQTILNDSQYARVDELLREVDFDRAHFAVQLHEELSVVRGVLRLPIYSEVRWKDDARAVVSSFTREWSLVESFVLRATSDENLATIVDSAQLALSQHQALRCTI